jgi:hypothetical protein
VMAMTGAWRRYTEEGIGFVLFTYYNPPIPIFLQPPC